MTYGGTQLDVTENQSALWHGIQQTEHAGGTMTSTTTNANSISLTTDSSKTPQPEVAPDEVERDESDITAADAGIVPWHGILAVEGLRSGDHRHFQPGALTHRQMSDRNGL